MRNDEQGALTAVEWAIKKYYLIRSDETLALGLNTSVEVVQQTMRDLGLVRPVGEETMKDAARKYLMEKSAVEKRDFLKRLDREEPIKLWEMAEGRAASTGELTINHEPQRIDITHQLLKVYGPPDGTIAGEVLRVSEESELATEPSE